MGLTFQAGLSQEGWGELVLGACSKGQATGGHPLAPGHCGSLGLLLQREAERVGLCPRMSRKSEKPGFGGRGGWDECLQQGKWLLALVIVPRVVPIPPSFQVLPHP